MGTRCLPVEMMYDHVWLDRLDYESTEVQYQLFLDQCMERNLTNHVLDSSSSQDDSITFKRVLIPQQLHPFIKLTEIEISTGVRIILPPPSDAKSEIIVAGDAENVKKAALMIQETQGRNIGHEAKSLMFPMWMMNDESVWLNRLQYDEAERDALVQNFGNFKDGGRGSVTDSSTKKEDHDESSLDESFRSSDLVSCDEDSSDDEFEESTLSPFSFSSELKREEALAEQHLEQEECKSISSLPSAETIQNGDLSVLKDAVISLTQAVSTLSIQNNKLNHENIRLKNRVKNTDERIDKMNKGSKNAAASTQSNMDIDQAIKKLEKSQKKNSAQFDDAMSSLRDHLHKKDTEYNGKIDKHRSELEKVITNKTRSIEEAIKEIKKQQQQQTSKQAPQTVKTTRSPTPTKTSVQESPMSSKTPASKSPNSASAQAGELRQKSVEVAENLNNSSCSDTSSAVGGSVSKQTWADRSPIPAANNQPKYPASVKKEVVANATAKETNGSIAEAESSKSKLEDVNAPSHPRSKSKKEVQEERLQNLRLFWNRYYVVLPQSANEDECIPISFVYQHYKQVCLHPLIENVFYSISEILKIPKVKKSKKKACYRVKIVKGSLPALISTKPSTSGLRSPEHSREEVTETFDFKPCTHPSAEQIKQFWTSYYSPVPQGLIPKEYIPLNVAYQHYNSVCSNPVEQKMFRQISRSMNIEHFTREDVKSNKKCYRVVKKISPPLKQQSSIIKSVVVDDPCGPSADSKNWYFTNRSLPENDHVSIVKWFWETFYFVVDPSVSIATMYDDLVTLDDAYEHFQTLAPKKTLDKFHTITQNNCRIPKVSRPKTMAPRHCYRVIRKTDF